MTRRIARLIATSILVASSFAPTAHASDPPTLHAVVTVWPLVDDRARPDDA